MALTSTDQAPGSLLYLDKDPGFQTEKPYFVRFPVQDIPGAKQTNMSFSYQDVQINDIRGHEQEFKLDEAGFELAPFMTRFSAHDFKNFSEIKEEYFREVESFLKQHLGVTWVQVFDCAIRKRNPEYPAKQFQDREVQPIRAVHIDYSRAVRLAKIEALTKNAGITQPGRVQMLGVWRPITEPVEDWPLALCDWRSCADKDVVNVDQVYPDHVGEASNLFFNPMHCWHFASNQLSSEAWILKMQDSKPNVSDYCAHAAFPWKETTPDKMRHSIEIRCVVFKPDA